MKKLWGSRFSKDTNELVNFFNASINFDKRLYKYDILGSIAHVKMLKKQEILSNEDANKIELGLKEILNEIELGEIKFDIDLEDIHTNIEVILTNKIGEVAKKMHTARSRNDQVALDLRMYVKEEIDNIKRLIYELNKSILVLAKDNLDTILSGYTHLQRAQPITFAHWILAYFEMFKRDYNRLEDSYKRVNICPLGSGALACSTYNIDRYKTAELLGFDDICLNSLDAVSDRDFAIETLSNISLIMMHLSRFCEEIILFTSYEFKFIELDDSFATGSSLMPQKKNPDVAELIRGKTGRVYGNLMSLLTVLKSLPLAYNKDMQEDKESIFDSIDTVKISLEVFNLMLKTIKLNKEKMEQSVIDGYLNATDLADYLVSQKGIPFRDAHKISGEIVQLCINKNKTLNNLSIEEYKTVCESIDESVYKYINIKNCIDKRKVIGGPSKEAILKVIDINEKFLDNIKCN